jgi:hypothetical protein
LIDCLQKKTEPMMPLRLVRIVTSLRKLIFIKVIDECSS